MYFAMAFQGTLATKVAGVLEFQYSGIGMGKYYRRIKIDEIAVIVAAAVTEADTMSIVTGRTGRSVLDVFSVFAETLII